MGYLDTKEPTKEKFVPKLIWEGVALLLIALVATFPIHCELTL